MANIGEQWCRNTIVYYLRKLAVECGKLPDLDPENFDIDLSVRGGDLFCRGVGTKGRYRQMHVIELLAPRVEATVLEDSDE